MKNTPQKQPNRTVSDTKNTEYQLIESLAEGGQGKVFKSNYKNVLIKMSKFPDSDPRTLQWNRQLEWVTRQNLEGLNIARPRILINKPRRGYVMELMDGLEPLQNLIQESCEKLQSGDGLLGFVNSGGLRRRLKILANLARLLAQLHGRALAFGDLSPSNIFVSQSLDQGEVWLIDCDNICAMSRAGGSKLWTPDFGAPEIMRGESGINTLTDSWSFAVIAFQLLTLLHPLKGDFVENGPVEDVDRALRGELPWVGHPTDKKNESTIGLPGHYVLTPKLFSLFEQCFNLGLNIAEERPSMAEWAEAFEAALALCIECENEVNCASSFYFNIEHDCPFCDVKQDSGRILEIRHFICAPHVELGVDPILDSSTSDVAEMANVFLESGYKEILSDQILELRSSPVGSSTYIDSKSVCRLQLDDIGLHIEPINDGVVTFEKMGATMKTSITRKLRLTRDKKKNIVAVLHIGDVNKTHAAWQFTW
jgi:serine/threonine protein kinase